MAFIVVIAQWFFSIALKNYAQDNSDPCEEMCEISEQVCDVCRADEASINTKISKIFCAAIVVT